MYEMALTSYNGEPEKPRPRHFSAETRFVY